MQGGSSCWLFPRLNEDLWNPTPEERSSESIYLNRTPALINGTRWGPAWQASQGRAEPSTAVACRAGPPAPPACEPPQVVPLAPRQELQQQGSGTLLLPHFRKVLRPTALRPACCGEGRCPAGPCWPPMLHGTPWLLRGHGWVQSTGAKGIAKHRKTPQPLSPPHRGRRGRRARGPNKPPAPSAG